MQSKSAELQLYAEKGYRWTPRYIIDKIDADIAQREKDLAVWEPDLTVGTAAISQAKQNIDTLKTKREKLLEKNVVSDYSAGRVSTVLVPYPVGHGNYPNIWKRLRVWWNGDWYKSYTPSDTLVMNGINYAVFNVDIRNPEEIGIYSIGTVVQGLIKVLIYEH